MVTNSSCKVALIFYNCEHKQNEFDFDHIFVYYNLDNIEADYLKNI